MCDRLIAGEGQCVLSFEILCQTVFAAKIGKVKIDMINLRKLYTQYDAHEHGFPFSVFRSGDIL